MQNLRQDASSLRNSDTGLTVALAGWLAWLGFAVWGVHDHWSANAQYNYGWLVVPLAGLLAWRRWQCRPAPEPAPSWAMPVLVASAAALLPIWVIAQPNAEWRLIPGVLICSVVGGSLGFVAMLGGRAWARHFAFPIFFLLTAVPWPGFIEAPLVQGLMKAVAEVTVVILNATGVPALQRGNLVEITSGILGVDEACSGVRSIQATFMAALFLGELHRLRTATRVGLVLAAFAIALVTNVGRTWLLSTAAATEGMSAVQRFHDPAGYSIFTVCLILIAILAEILRRRHAVKIGPAATGAVNQLPRALGVALCAWIALAIAGTEVWYRTAKSTDAGQWTVLSPTSAKPNVVPAESLALLACDRQQSSKWADADGGEWTLFFFEWVPGTGRSAILARVHRPEICLQGVGLKEFGERHKIRVDAAGFPLAFESLEFVNHDGAKVYVFFCPWEFVPGGAGRNVTFSDATRLTSLERVWRRERWLGQQTLELVVTGYRDREMAESAFKREVTAIVRRVGQGATVPK